jgi:hypothetical protein
MMPPITMPVADTSQLPQNKSKGGTVVEVEKLEKKHPEYAKNEATWNLIKLLYEGGDRIRRESATVLNRRAKELDELYKERCSILTYQNILGSGIDYYLAAIFSQEPECDVYDKDQPRVKPIELPANVKIFWDEFQKNCDRKGSSMNYFFREVLRDALLYRTSWILIDLPVFTTFGGYKCRHVWGIDSLDQQS